MILAFLVAIILPELLSMLHVSPNYDLGGKKKNSQRHKMCSEMHL